MVWNLRIMNLLFPTQIVQRVVNRDIESMLNGLVLKFYPSGDSFIPSCFAHEMTQ